jgi:triphosphoribosyl-dephospho-CoA synthase
MREAFVRACRLDVAVRKPGNVSFESPGHGMQAAQFVASAEAAAGPLLRAGAPVGERIEGAVQASWAAAGCNTNLGILLLAAPLAAASERRPQPLRDAVAGVLAELTVDDAAAAFRAIARANPGGLGRADAEDVHAPPTLDLRSAMVLAARRDSIARQYGNGFADVFALAPPALPQDDGDEMARIVRGIFVGFLARWPDSHIVRKHGEAVAHSVMTAAQGFNRGCDAAAWAEWDESLKARGINPGTSADLTVAALFTAGLQAAWHGS